jgi:tetratricopeptide (TPR) repeat protein
MNRKEVIIWSAFAIIFLCILYLTVRRRGADSAVKKGSEDFYQQAMRKFDPVEYHSQRAYAFDAEHSFELATYYKMGMKDQAIAEIEEVLRRDPYNWVQRESIGDIYREKGDVDEALRQYEQALGINPENALCNRKIGKLYHQKGEYRSAVMAFKRSVEIDPGFSESHLELGLSYYALGDKEGALAEMKKLEELKRADMASQISEAIGRMKAQ